MNEIEIESERERDFERFLSGWRLKHLLVVELTQEPLIIQNIENWRLVHSDTWRELGECYKICLNWTMGREEKILRTGRRILTDDKGLKKTELLEILVGSRVSGEVWSRHWVPDEDWRRHSECRAKIEEGTDFSQLAASFIDPHLGQNPLY